jgi:hypothetical protein
LALAHPRAHAAAPAHSKRRARTRTLASAHTAIVATMAVPNTLALLSAAPAAPAFAGAPAAGGRRAPAAAPRSLRARRAARAAALLGACVLAVTALPTATARADSDHAASARRVGVGAAARTRAPLATGALGRLGESALLFRGGASSVAAPPTTTAADCAALLACLRLRGGAAAKADGAAKATAADAAKGGGSSPEGPGGVCIGIDLGTTYSCVGVWQVRTAAAAAASRARPLQRPPAIRARACPPRARPPFVCAARRPLLARSHLSFCMRRSRASSRRSRALALSPPLSLFPFSTNQSNPIQSNPIQSNFHQPINPTRRLPPSASQGSRVEIIPNELGQRITPSYVAWALPAGLAPDSPEARTAEPVRLIGDAAKAQAARNPGGTVYDAKRLIGRSFADETVQRDRKYARHTARAAPREPHCASRRAHAAPRASERASGAAGPASPSHSRRALTSRARLASLAPSLVSRRLWPFKVVERNGRPFVAPRPTGQGGGEATAGFQKEFSPEEVSAMILFKMKSVAEAFLGQPVKSAVVTVRACAASRRAARPAARRLLLQLSDRLSGLT